MIQYKNLIRKILEEGETHEDRTGIGTLSLTGEQIKVDMRDRFPLLTLRKLPFRWIAQELLWMLSGSTDENELAAEGVFTWANWATTQACAEFGRKPGDLGPTYGFLLRSFGATYRDTQTRREWSRSHPNDVEGIDQLWRLCQLLDTDPYSRRLVVSQWDPLTSDALTVPPCHPYMQVKVHKEGGHEGQEEMSLHVFSRSQDAMVGLAFDLAHFGLLLELLCWATCRRPRFLIISFTDVHIYLNTVSAARDLCLREPQGPPMLFIGKEMWHGEPSSPGVDTFVNLLGVKYEHLVLNNYDPLPKMDLAVAV